MTLRLALPSQLFLQDIGRLHRRASAYQPSSKGGGDHAGHLLCHGVRTTEWQWHQRPDYSEGRCDNDIYDGDGYGAALVPLGKAT